MPKDNLDILQGIVYNVRIRLLKIRFSRVSKIQIAYLHLQSHSYHPSFTMYTFLLVGVDNYEIYGAR